MLTRSTEEQNALYAKQQSRDMWVGPNNPEVVILSAECAKFEASDNTTRTAQLKARLEYGGFIFKSVIGSYLGREEDAFAVVLPSDDYARAERLMELTQLANEFDQESILHLDRYRQATLLFNDGSTQAIGYFRDASEALAKQYNSWTYDPVQDLWFICR